MATMSDAKEIGIYLGGVAVCFAIAFGIAAVIIRTRTYNVYVDDDGITRVVRPIRPPSTDSFRPPTTNIERYRNVPPNEAPRTKRHRAHPDADPHRTRQQEKVGA